MTRAAVSQAAAEGSSLGVKADFPIFAREFDGRPLVYLDSAATSQKPAVVIEAVADHLRNHNANVHRGVYALAQEADAAYDGARRRVAAFTGAQSRTRRSSPRTSPRRSTSSPTPGAARTSAPGDAVLITQAEHHANIVPWQVLCRERGASLRYLEVDEHGAALARTRSTHELARGRRAHGGLHARLERARHDQPRRGDGRARACRRGGLAHRRRPGRPADAGRRRRRSARTSTRWTGHKALGPTGIGVLHGRREILEAMEPFLTGGDMIASVDFQSATWNELPAKFEAGTPMVAEAVGLGAAVDYLARLGMDRVRAHERALTAYMLERLAQVPGPARGRAPRRRTRAEALRRSRSRACTPTTSPSWPTARGVCIRAGHHCAQPLMRCLGVSATARASVGVYNEPADIDALVEA